VAARVFPEGLITGTMPASLLEGSGAKPKASQHPTAREPAYKTDFTQEDLDSLVIYMDSALSDNSSSSKFWLARHLHFF